MDLMEALYQRRSVRAFTEEPVPAKQVRMLLDAAIQAPSAMNHQPWAFVVIQDPKELKRLSDEAKAHYLNHADLHPTHHSPLHAFHDTLANPDYNLFYDASTLILICATSASGFAPGDCCFAAQNLMLAAHGMGLATCTIGLAVPWLSHPATKAELGIPDDYLPMVPLILGHPREQPLKPERQPPEVLRWVRRAP